MKSRFEQWERNFRTRQQQQEAAPEAGTPQPPRPPFFPRQSAPETSSAPNTLLTQPPVASTPGGTAWDWKPRMPDVKGFATQTALRNAESAQARGDVGTAVRWYQRALKLDPADQEVQAKLAAAQALKQKVTASTAPATAKKAWYNRL